MVTNGFRMLSEYANAPCIGKRAVGVMKRYFLRISLGLGLTMNVLNHFIPPQTKILEGRMNILERMWETAFARNSHAGLGKDFTKI